LGVAIATDYFNVGSRTDRRDTFLCLSKEKYPKEKTPECRLFPALLAFERGCRKGLLPLRQRDASLHRPCGLIRSKAPVLGAAYGINPIRNSKFHQPLKNNNFKFNKPMLRSSVFLPYAAPSTTAFGGNSP
jgi:hypothetical protein